MKKRTFFILPAFAVTIITVTAFVLGPFKNNDNSYIKTELYFGLSKPGGGSVSSAEWEAFADTVITVSLINGSTLIDAKGQWFAGGKFDKEDSKILIILFPESDTVVNEKLEIIRSKYIKYFDQQSVLRVDQTVQAHF